MNAIVEKSLSQWGLTHVEYTLIAARENAVYKLKTPTETFALRLHRKGYRSDAELESELLWMKAVSDGGLAVPAPILSRTGDVIHVVGGIQVDV